MKEIIMAKKIANKVKECGGSTYYVGGCVRDKLLGIPNKDIDIEVHGISLDVLSGILDSLGKRKLVGESFGIFMLKGYDLDISIPRKETKRGNLHQDFDITIDPYIGTYNAAKRRDFTINALMEDVLSGEVIDHFGGLDDLKNHIIRHVNEKSFTEDSLRVLRGCQFASRFGFEIDESTVELCKTIDITNLPKERIEGELKKALLKAKKPSIFFEYLRKMGKLDDWFFELSLLLNVKQNPTYHNEGNVYIHTMTVLDAASSLREDAENPYYFMLSALCHDFGKVEATKEINGVIKAINHENMGDDLIKSFLHRFTSEKKLVKYVLNMTHLHMAPNIYARDHSSIKATNKLFDESVAPLDLILLSHADKLGQINDLEKVDNRPFLLDRLKKYEELMKEDEITGSDLIELGLKPRSNYAKALEYAHNLHLSLVKKKEALPQVVRYFEELSNKKDRK